LKGLNSPDDYLRRLLLFRRAICFENSLVAISIPTQARLARHRCELLGGLEWILDKPRTDKQRLQAVCTRGIFVDSVGSLGHHSLRWSIMVDDDIDCVEDIAPVVIMLLAASNGYHSCT
jgi:hypothetical protein